MFARRGPALWGRARELAAELDRATPVSRERAVDGLRAVAICGVVLGHWLVSALVLWEDGGLRLSSPLRAFPEPAPLSWVLQTLGLFFFLGGYVTALGLDRARARGEPVREWLRPRTTRLGRPVILCLALWGVLTVALTVAGVPDATVRTAAVLTVQPLWFIAVYLALVAVGPPLLAADRRWGLAAIALPLAVVAAVDLARYGPWEDSVPDGLGAVNVPVAWLAIYQLGISWRRGRLTPRRAWFLLAGATAVFGLLVAALDYPTSAVGIPGEERGNLNPPSLFTPALALIQASVAVLLYDRLDRLLRRPVPWAVTATLNRGALTVFCWHQSALLAVTLVGTLWGVVPGLTSTPDDTAWILARLGWLIAFTAVLLVLSLPLRRYEEPWRRGPLSRSPARALLTAAAGFFLGYALWAM